jgi:hypothetical protein
MNLYIPFIHKLIKKEKKQIQLPLYIEKYPKIIEREEKDSTENIIIIDLF